MADTSAVIVGGMLGSGFADYVDAMTGGGTYTVASPVNVVLGSSGPLAGFLELLPGKPYVFTAAQAAQLAAAGVVLTAS